MVRYLLKVTLPDITFTKILAECIFKADQLVKSANQICRSKKNDMIKAKTEVIKQQKKEIENLKATNMQMDLEKLIEAMSQAMACMHNMQKDPGKTLSGTKSVEGKPYLGKAKQPQITKGIDGTTDSDLMCQYCKGSGNELDNCGKLQGKLQKNSWQQKV